MDLFLGIDGGGTGCRAVLADASGHVLGRGEAGPANIASDFPGALDNILTATRLACGTHDLTTLVAGLGLAGANAADVSDRLAQSLPFARVAIETDAITAVRGALGAADGIVAAIGTGSVFAAQRGGQVRQIGGWGLVMGDEGSGAWIGRAILSAALRAVDGFHPMTPLLASLIESHGGPSGVVSFSLTAKPGDFARLAPQVLDSADPAARTVVAKAAADVAAAITLLQGGDGLPVVYLGGLGPSYAAAHADRWTIIPAKGSALDGALSLARTLHQGAP